MLEILYVIEYESDDFDFSGDPLEESLVVDDKVVLSGDWYHDKISSQIEGFRAALDFLNIEYNWVQKEINESPDGGDNYNG